MKTVAIIAARMASSRLPDKVLRPLLGVSMLEHMILRLKKCDTLDEIVVATTEKNEDEAICRLALEKGCLSYRGSDQDVLGRIYGAAIMRNAAAIVRLTGDCPLIDPDVVDAVVKRHRAIPHLDFTSNIFHRSYPRGLDTEVLSMRCLTRLHETVLDDIYREHVTNYIYDHPSEFRIESVVNDNDRSDLRICVDTEADWRLVTQIYEALYPNNHNFGVNDIAEFLEARPELKKINAHVRQAKIFMHRTRP